MRENIAIVAGPREWGDTRESWLEKVCRLVPTVPYRTVKSLWYGEIHDPNHWAARDIKRAAELIGARKEAAALASQFVSTATGMRNADSDFYSAEIDRLERLVGIIGGLDSTGNNRG